MDQLNRAIREDCTNLITAFASHENTEFKNFCLEWKRIQFQHIYSGFLTDAEIARMTEIVINIVKELMFENRPFLEKLGCLYLLYSIYYKQPTREFCKITVTIETWLEFKKFLSQLELEHSTQQAQYIFWKLTSTNAFRFVVSDETFMLNNAFNKQNYQNPKQGVGQIKDILKSDFNEIQHEHAGFLAAFEILEDGYNEMKDLINKEADLKTSGKLEKSNIFKELKEGFNNIYDILITNTSFTTEPSQDEGIRAIRVKLKRKALKCQKHQNLDFDISLSGDFIKIIKKDNEKCLTEKIRKRKIQSVKCIMDQKLPKETIAELEFMAEERCMETLPELEVSIEENQATSSAGCKLPLLTDASDSSDSE